MRLIAPDGVVGPHREKEGSFYAIREIYSPVKIDLKTLPNDFNGVIPIENRYHFTNLNELQFKWKLMKFNTAFDSEDGFDLIKMRKVSLPNIKPTEKGQLNLRLPENWKENDALYLTATDSFGKEIYTWTWRIKSNDEISKQFSKSLIKEFSDSVIENDSLFI